MFMFLVQVYVIRSGIDIGLCFQQFHLTVASSLPISYIFRALYLPHEPFQSTHARNIDVLCVVLLLKFISTAITFM